MESEAVKRGLGAPTKLTPKVQRDFVAIIRRSGFYSDACAAVGITESTFQNWRNRGEANEQPFFDFLVAVRRAEIDRRQGYLEESKKRGAKKHDAREIQWRAQVTDPERFSIKHHVVVQQQLDSAIARLKEEFADEPETLERALSAIAGESRGGGVGGHPHSARPGDAEGGDAAGVDPLEAITTTTGIPRPGG
jgi:hypothetical protein